MAGRQRCQASDDAGHNDAVHARIGWIADRLATSKATGPAP